MGWRAGSVAEGVGAGWGEALADTVAGGMK